MMRWWMDYVLVPSLSWGDFKEEGKELKSVGESLPLCMLQLTPIAFILGNISDYIMRKVIKGMSW